MTKADIKKVISKLYRKKEPITKKEACELLGVSYQQLDKIVTEYLDEKTRKDENKDLPLNQDQVIFVIQEYIDGGNIPDIAKKLYRSQGIIQQVLETYQVPLRGTEFTYHNPPAIPKNLQRKKFNIMETVFSVRYGQLAEIMRERLIDPHGLTYSVWLKKDEFFAYQKPSDLSSLNHLAEMGIKL